MSDGSYDVMYVVPFLVIFAITTTCCLFLVVILCYGKYGCPCCSSRSCKERRRRKALTSTCRKKHYGRSHFYSNERCPICLEDFHDNEVVRMTPCSHALHDDCLFRCLEISPNCPLCKATVLEPKSDTPLLAAPGI